MLSIDKMATVYWFQSSRDSKPDYILIHLDRPVCRSNMIQKASVRYDLPAASHWIHVPYPRQGQRPLQGTHPPPPSQPPST